MSDPNYPRLYSIGAITALWQRPISTVEHCLNEVGAVPMFALNGVPYFSSVDADRGLLHMCEHYKRPAPAASNMIFGPPEGPVEFEADGPGDGDDDQPDDDPTPPAPANRLAKILGGANRG